MSHLEDEHEPNLRTSVSHNLHEHPPLNMNRNVNQLHPPAIIGLGNDDEKGDEATDEDEDEDKDEVSSDPELPGLESEGDDEDEDDKEATESHSEFEPDLDFGPARPTDNEDAAMLQRLLAERRAPLGTAFRDIAISINGKRRGPRGMVGMATSYVDQDTSGTYDPSKQRRHIRPNKRSRSHSHHIVNESSREKEGHGKSNRRELKVTFQFKKESSLNYLRLITLDPASTSSSSIVNNTSSAGSSDLDSGINSEFCVQTPPLALVLQKRKSKKRRRVEVQDFLEREDGLTLKDLTEGHPQRRGCKACFLSGNDDCSFMNNHSHYPCTACDDASVDCELIITPILKKSCQRCKRRKIACSYKSNGGRGVDKCKDCDEEDEPCCAAPLDENSGYSKRFIDTAVPSTSPASTAVEKSKVSKQVKKLSCKGKMTAREKHRQKRPLKKENIPKEVIKSLPEKSKVRGSKDQRLLAKSARLANLKHMRLGSLVIQELLDATNGIRHKYVETAFSHPIIFNHEPSEDNTDPCSWCISPLFGMWGHGEVKVEVIPYGGVRGNEEVGHGHYHSGKPQSKMCVSCTMARVRITTCKSHKIMPISNVDSRSFSATEYNDSLQALHAGDEVGGALAKITKWCSICTSIADFSCCQPNLFPNPEFVGCGLNLCKICHWTLGRIEQGVSKKIKFNVMDQLVKLRKKELYNWEGDEVRADSDFLRSDGEMMIRFREGM